MGRLVTIQVYPRKKAPAENARSPSECTYTSKMEAPVVSLVVRTSDPSTVREQKSSSIPPETSNPVDGDQSTEESQHRKEWEEDPTCGFLVPEGFLLSRVPTHIHDNCIT